MPPDERIRVAMNAIREAWMAMTQEEYDHTAKPGSTNCTTRRCHEGLTAVQCGCAKFAAETVKALDDHAARRWVPDGLETVP